jgi:hypothetical protein
MLKLNQTKVEKSVKKGLDSEIKARSLDGVKQFLENFLRRKIPNCWDSSSGEFDFIGVIMLVCIIFLCVIFPLAFTATFMIYLHVVHVGFLPWEIIIDECLESHGVSQYTSIVLIVFHTFFCLPIIAECSRALGIILIFFVSPVQLVLRSIKLVGDLQIRYKALRCSGQRYFHQIFHQYDKLRIINNGAMPAASLEISVLFLAGVLLSIAANVGTIRMYHFLPWYIYVICPLFVIVVFLLIQLLLPQGIDIYENSQAMLGKWALEIDPRNISMRRKLKSEVAIKWYAGCAGIYECNFFLVESSVKRNFYYVILDYTIMFIILLPTSVLKGGFKF